MFFKKLNEAGYEEALFGLSLSFYDHKQKPFLVDDSLRMVLHQSRLNTRHAENPECFWTDAKLVKAEKIGKIIATKQPSSDLTARDNADYIRAERKFLRSIIVWGYLQAPRSFWAEFDTYQVGMTKNSSSTMHTLDKRPVVPEDFEESTSPNIISAFNEALSNYKNPEHPYYKDIARLKENLPEGWLQERQFCTNYEVLRAIINQRGKHRLWYWQYFCQEVLAQVNNPELLGIMK